MNDSEKIRLFLESKTFAVVGASTDREKYGNKVLRAYLQNEKQVVAINPREKEIEGVACYADLAAVPEPVEALSIVTPPAVTEKIIDEAARAGVRHVWMQPGAESPAAIRQAESHGMTTIAAGPCVLVALRYREEHA